MGCTIGYFVGGWISLNIGKRIMMIVCNIGSVITWIMLAFISNEVVLIIIERFVMGIFIAAAFGCIGDILIKKILPSFSKCFFFKGTYISETSHSKLRNILITFQTSGTMLGYLIAYIIGTIFEDWRDSALALVAVPLMGSLTMVLFPETPFWLASVGRLQDSR